MTKAKKVFYILMCILLVFSIVGHLKDCVSKAEIEYPPIPEPDPSYGWDDYTSEHPILTPEPSPTPEVTRQPGLPILGATNFYQNCRLRSYRYFVSPDSTPGNIVHAYQNLTHGAPIQSSVPGYAAVTGTMSNGMRMYSSANRSGSQPILDSSNSNINMIDSYIVFDWEIRFTSAVDITLGQGLDYGYVGVIGANYVINCQDHFSGAGITNVPISVYVYEYFDNGFIRTSRVSPDKASALMDLTRGFAVEVKSDMQDRKLARVLFKVMIGVDAEQDAIPAEQTRSITSVDFTSGSSAFEIRAAIQELDVTRKTIWEAILDLPMALARIIVPSQSDVQSWLNRHTENVSDSPVMIAFSAYQQMLQAVLDGDTEGFVLKIPALHLNVGTHDITYFPGIEWAMSNADIQIPGSGHTLFWYSRLIGDCVIVAGFITNYVYKLWKRIFDVSFASGAKGS